ncbi:ribonuclease M5 [Clostridium sp. D2Q-11]|uniref:Ribonuclease M5 n=1 Tax=Anaeromonas frigoriresistens TaxID=2683708 RepID=A0A942V0P5_9FIRM|nr:ribonuclease M5 [Anaeromonas frigoriresistens]MBS4537902.1 ribonuclease M5 [Anaeromonas frigoriresistens]
MIKEVIVVEGKDDVSALKKAVDCEVIITGGFGYPDDLIERIKLAQKNRGTIILTDPDFAGEKIRNYISSRVKGCKHAFLPRDKAILDGDIGIENAKPEDIIEALKGARFESQQKRNEFTKSDLLRNGLNGGEDASYRRDFLGKILGIGYCNSKQFLKRLNNYGITREEFNKAIERMNDRDE